LYFGFSFGQGRKPAKKRKEKEIKEEDVPLSGKLKSLFKKKEKKKKKRIVRSLSFVIQSFV